MTEEIIINEKSLQAVLKRCDKLEQENKELKEIINKSARSFCNDYLKTFEENKFLNNQIMEVKFNAQQEIEFLTEEKNNYRSALEEIKNDLKEVCKEECDYTKPKFCGDCDCRYGQILNKINEVLND